MTTSSHEANTAIDTNRRSAKHIGRACLGCRRRKAKCNGATPKCANCLLYNQECVMPRDVDKRKLLSKDRLSGVMGYVKTLEALLLDHGIALPDRPDMLRSMFAKNSDDHAVPRNETENPVSAAQAPLSARRWSLPSETSNNLSTVMEQLTDTVGSMQIAEDGEFHYFGATSNLHILHVGSLSLEETFLNASNQQRQEDILRAYGVDYEVDEELENHLIKLYFSWEDPNIPVVDQQVYFSERKQCRGSKTRSRKYSEALTNAMCAVGATLTPRYCHNLPEDLPNFFLTKAKVLLEMELSAPMLCTVQSLVILSGMEAVFTRDTRGWLFSGMAMRLAVDLGLHIKVVRPINGTSITPEEERLRSKIFWGAYIHERMWSVYVGRPESLSDDSISIPRLDCVTDTALSWQPYIDDDQQNIHHCVPGLLEKVRCELITLCCQIPAITKALYNASPKSLVDIGLLPQLSLSMGEQLSAWFRQLPEELHLNLDDVHCCGLPHTIQLHMQFYALRIIVDRPFLSLASNAALSDQDISRSQKSCFDAASSIARLAQIYRRQYTLRRANIQTVHLIFTAALIHVHHAYLSGDGEIQGTAARYLEICSQALSELGLAYKNARRALEVITYIKADLFRCRQATGLNDYAGDIGRSNTSAGWQFFEPTNTISSSIFNFEGFEQLYKPTGHSFEEEFDPFQAVEIGPAQQVPDGFAI